MNKIVAQVLISLSILFLFSCSNPSEFTKSKFNGTKFIDFCRGESYMECKKICEQESGINCNEVSSKSEVLQKGKCYYYFAQQEQGDPCSYCVIDCRN